MIHVYCNLDTGTYNFKFSKDIQHFSDVVALLKEQYHCGYNEKFQEWFTIKALLAKNIIADLQAYDKIDISKEDRQLIDEMIYPQDKSYKKVKSIINKEWIKKHPPILGKNEFKDYQLESIKFMLNRNRGILSLAPGTGKSYIAEGYLSSIKNIENKKILWICRLEGQTTTALKVLHFLSDYYTENDLTIVGTDNREIENYFDKKIIISNYTTFKLSNEYYYKQKMGKKSIGHKPNKTYIDFTKWGNKEDLVIIVDEGQALKNINSYQSKTFIQCKDYFNYRYCLSGSLGYNILDYFALCKFLIPESMPYSFSEFRDYISVKGSYGKKSIPHRVKEFKEKVLNEIQISFTENVLDLPPFKEEEIYVQMTDKMKSVYQSFINTSIEEAREKKENELNYSQIENMFMTLAMATSDLSLIDDKFNESWNIKENPKIEIIESMLEKFIIDENRKVVIWCNHPKIINQLKEIYKKYKPIIIHGDESTSVKRNERDTLITEFRNSKDKNLLICSYVLNSSIDLYEATREIYFDCIIDTDKFNQSKKRLWRLGQKERVEAYYLLFNGSIDIYIYNEILLRRNKIRNIMIEKKELTEQDYKNVFNAKAQFYWTDT